MLIPKINLTDMYLKELFKNIKLEKYFFALLFIGFNLYFSNVSSLMKIFLFKFTLSILKFDL